jgi:hypothetical protein
MTDSEEDFFITIDDMRRFGYCGKGSRKWAEEHGLSWAKFVHEGGMMASVLAEKGDGMAHKFIAEVRAKRSVGDI